MARPRIDLGAAHPLLNVASYARRGPGERLQLSQEEIQLLSRTVRRTPEVMVKVLTRGGKDLKAVGRHLSYLSREGEVEIETDDGRHLRGERVEQELVEDWDLDLEAARRTKHLSPRPGIVRPKLVHKVVLSMPAGTPADGLLRAARTFARETFGAKHRYVMALHTDEPHPHVHMVVKAVSEEGVRLNIRKATLREWRRDFARHLRAQGIAANATDRAVRGATRPKLSDGMYRALQRDASRRNLDIEEAAGLKRSDASEASGRASLVRTRSEVERGWLAAAGFLDHVGQQDLAWCVRRFVEALPPVRTDQELSRQQPGNGARAPPQRELIR